MKIRKTEEKGLERFYLTHEIASGILRAVMH